jgi:hypothetical protein
MTVRYTTCVLTLYSGDDWSREETDYLFNMLREWDLRWFIVLDRWDFPSGPQRDLPVSNFWFECLCFLIVT